MLRQNMTATEKILWQKLRGKKLGTKFLRQHPVYAFTEDSWQYRFIIADFYCHASKLIIELDGEVHDILEVEELDAYKEKLLIEQWYTIIRFKNSGVTDNLDWVLNIIQKNCSPSP